MENKTYLNLQYIVLCIFAFVLPFSTPTLSYLNFTPILLAIIGLIWLLGGKFGKKFRLIKTNNALLPFLSCIGLYLLYLIGTLYSENLNFAKKDLLLKLPLLSFPLIIFSMDTRFFTKERIIFILKLFVTGNIVAAVASLIHSWILYLQEPVFSHFHYVEASWFHHPSYASMYYCFSFAIIIYLILTQSLKKQEKIIGGIGLVLFIVEIILLDSRAGILAFGGTVLAYGIYLILKKRINIKTIVIIIGLGIALIGTYALLPNNANRIQSTIKSLEKETFSTSDPQKANVRILIWDASMEVALKNLPFGVGTGDIKDELLKQYAIDNYTIPYEENYNAHNQYLQIFVTLGILGVLVFLMISILPFWIGFKKGNILFIIFGIIICINFLVESMLEKQAGVMFFTFFFPLLYYISQQNTENQKQ